MSAENKLINGTGLAIAYNDLKTKIDDIPVEKGSGQNSIQSPGSDASGNYAQALGWKSLATGIGAHAEGSYAMLITTADGQMVYQNIPTMASGTASHAEGKASQATAEASHAEGTQTEASASNSHAEGYKTKASSQNSHAEGNVTTASGSNSHAEGNGTTASGNNSHAEGQNTIASGLRSHAHGYATIANHADQTVFGQQNVADPSNAASTEHGNYIEIVGNGSGGTRSNARTLDWNGNEVLAGSLTIGGDEQLTKAQLQAMKGLDGRIGNTTMGTTATTVTGAIAEHEGDLGVLKSAVENVDTNIANGYKNADLEFAHGWFSSGSYNPSDNRYISKVFKTDDLINLVNGSTKAGYLQYFTTWNSWSDYTYGTYQAVSGGQTKAIDKRYSYVAYQSTATVESELSGIVLQEALKVDYLSKGSFCWLDNSKNVLGLQWLAGYIGISGDMSAGATDRSCTTFIPCPPGVTINYKAETNHASVCGIAFYDKNRTFISGLANNATIGTEATATSPENTAYLRISTRNEIMADTYFKFDGYNQELMWLQSQISDLTVYVDGTNGNDTTGTGTSGAPYKTISKALTTAARHICVKPGTYQEKVSASFREYLHLYADELTWGNYADRQKVIIDGNSSIDTPLDLSYIRRLELENIVVKNSASGKKGCVITYCEKLEMQNCEFHNNGHDGCVINYTNGIIRDCKANGNGNDGFNMNYYGDTQFYNCSGHDNVDDGISHHQGTTGMINGGEWYNNGKGGVASPAHGSQVDIYNVYCHDNGYGIYANADSDTTARTFHVWNSVLVNNSHYGITSKRNTAILYNCKITGNTEGQTTAPSGGSIVDLSN